MNSSPWRLEEVDGGDEQYPVESRFAVRHTPPDEQDPRFDRSAPTKVCFLRFAVCHTPPDQQDPRFDRRRSVSSVLRYARPLPMNRIPFRTWPVEHKAVSSILRYARPRFHRLFRPSPPDEHDDAFRSDPALDPHEHDDDAVSPFQPSHVHEPWPYVCASRRSRPRPYVHIRGRIFFLAPWPLYVRVHATCAPLLRHVHASTSTNIYVRTRSGPE